MQSQLLTYISIIIDVSTIDVNTFNTFMCSSFKPCSYGSYVLVISQYDYDILVITRVQGEAEDEC